MIIHVTAAHIANGVRSNCSADPVARALAEAFPEAGELRVAPTAGVWRVDWSPPGDPFNRRHKDLPVAVGLALEHWDRTGRMTAFEFEFDLETAP